ncbi:MAG TPA: hypothetical protein VD966_06400 [Pyrinomonadaceae bacterium]|nr:hypothetical protein [Pyrinomonadaceae bacterium]
MSGRVKNDKISAGDRLIARALEWAPWLAFLLITFPLPLYFLLRYLTAVEEAGVYMLLVLSSLAVGSVMGIIAVVLLLLYRRHWANKLRNRLAADGVTASELSWFMSELTTAERQALKQIEEQDALLADAYRETLAARITAARVAARTKRDLLLVERRLNRASYIQGVETAALQEELRADRARLERIKLEAAERRAAAEARLQMIEAAAARGASWAETDLALQRLSTTQAEIPLALEAARLEQQAREDVERDLHKEKRV